MKKVTLLLLLVIMASTLLMAAAPLKLVRVWTINKSAHTIYMKLEGQVEENFYYLTIPWGDKELPDHSSYTIVTDIYSRTTWYGPGDLDCEGLKSTGELWAVKQMKLTFTPCGQVNEYKYWALVDTDGDGVLELVSVGTGKILWGEPSWGEKVAYWEYLVSGAGADALGCWWSVDSAKYRSPNRNNCFFLYKY